MVNNQMSNSTSDEFFLTNISVYAAKTTSMIVLLMGQIFFRCRHPDQAYALRTHYTIKSNRTWNEINRNNRIQKKNSLKTHVEEMRTFLADIII